MAILVKQSLVLRQHQFVTQTGAHLLLRSVSSFPSKPWLTTPGAFKNSPGVIRVLSGGLWLVAEYSLAEAQRDLALHEVRHREKRDFAFIMRTPDETTGLGCVYILPLFQFLHRFPAIAPLQSKVTESAVIITFWVRQDQQDTPLAAQVINAVHNWILTEWPFDDHVFRVNPDEHASIRALEACGFKVRFEVTMDESPYHYLFFGKDATS